MLPEAGEGPVSKVAVALFVGVTVKAGGATPETAEALEATVILTVAVPPSVSSVLHA
jgi:hypothetical protein